MIEAYGEMVEMGFPPLPPKPIQRLVLPRSPASAQAPRVSGGALRLNVTLSEPGAEGSRRIAQMTAAMPNVLRHARMASLPPSPNICDRMCSIVTVAGDAVAWPASQPHAGRHGAVVRHRPRDDAAQAVAKAAYRMPDP